MQPNAINPIFIKALWFSLFFEMAIQHHGHFALQKEVFNSLSAFIDINGVTKILETPLI